MFSNHYRIAKKNYKYQIRIVCCKISNVVFYFFGTLTISFWFLRRVKCFKRFKVILIRVITFTRISSQVGNFAGGYFTEDFRF